MPGPNDNSGSVTFLDVLQTFIADKRKNIIAQVGNVIGRTVDSVGAEWWQHVGFISRPSKPAAGKASARAIALRTGRVDAIIASEDDRGLELKGNLADGETCVYAPGEDGKGQARILLKKDGSISLYTKTGNTDSGKGMIIQIDAQNDAIRITNGKGYGLVIDGDGAKLFTGGSGSGLTLAAGGDVKLVASGKCLVDGGNICLGALATPATPVCGGPAGIAAIPSTKVFMSVA